MVANTSPIYTIAPDVSTNSSTGMSQGISTAAADYDGTSANYATVHTAGANGSYVRKLRFKAKGTNGATVARIFINNGSTAGTASNNAFFGEISLPATSASTTSATPELDYAMEIALPAGFKVLVGLGATASAGWVCVAVAGKY